MAARATIIDIGIIELASGFFRQKKFDGAKGQNLLGPAKIAIHV